MSPKSQPPSGPGPEASEAMTELRDGIARARRIVREAKQAIGGPSPEGAVLADATEAEERDAVIPARAEIPLPLPGPKQ